MTKIDTAGFDDTAAEDEPSTVAKGMNKLLKKKKKGKKGKKKKGTKKAKKGSKNKAEPEPEPEPEPEEPEETPEEAAAREAAEEEAARAEAEEKGQWLPIPLNMLLFLAFLDSYADSSAICITFPPRLQQIW